MVFAHSVSIVFYGFNCFGAQKSLKEILKYYLKCTNLYVKFYTQIRSIIYYLQYGAKSARQNNNEKW